VTSSEEAIPLSGYRLEKVYAIELKYELIASTEALLDSEKRETTLFWDWSVTGERAVEVYMRAEVAGNREVPEQVTVALLGEFRYTAEPSVLLDKFVSVHAPAMLLPYLRESVSTLTGRGPYKPYFLPSVNVVELGESYDFAKTLGAEQIRNDPDLAERLGLAQLLLELVQPET
jgi:preprotein translocase subunit SecB